MSGFERYAPASAAFFCAPLTMAFIMGALKVSGVEVFRPGDYGPAVYALPLYWWAGFQIGFSVAAIIGHLRLIWWLGAAGAVGLCGLFSFFAWSAVQGGAIGGPLVSMALATAPLCLLIAGVAVWGRDGR